jgi:hypothetical protein
LRGEGQDVIYDYDTTAGNSDVPVFGEDIAAEQLWFRKSGSNDKTTINNWHTFAPGAYRMETLPGGRRPDQWREGGHVLMQAAAKFNLPARGVIEDAALLEIIGNNRDLSGGCA